MSGLLGVFTFEENAKVYPIIYYGMYALQHRGQESVGIATLEDKVVTRHVNKGLMSEHFGKGLIENMPGSKGLGFLKYKFRNKDFLEMPYEKDGGILAIDGIIYNENFNLDDFIDVLNGDIHEITEYVSELDGIFAFIFMNNERLIAMRNRDGVKPLSIGKYDEFTIVASETSAIDSIGGKVIREIQAGELFVKTRQTKTSYYILNNFANEGNVDAFEFVYTARPDSFIDGISVYQARYRLGEALWQEDKLVDHGVVIGAPDSGMIAALGYAQASGLDYRDGFVRNRYVGRTFIKSSQLEREQGVQVKLNPIHQNVSNKDIILVDDSIVRGTTIQRTVKSLKDKGARSVHVRIASPPVVRAEHVTIDIPDKDELIAANHTLEEMVKLIGCDSLRFLSLDGFHRAIGRDDFYENYFIREEENK